MSDAFFFGGLAIIVGLEALTAGNRYATRKYVARIDDKIDRCLRLLEARDR